MKKIINKLRRKDGLSYPFVACIVLVLLILTLGICEVIRINIISAGIRDKFQSAVISETTNNYVMMYQPLRDGYASSYRNSGSGWQQSTRTTRARIQNRLNQSLTTGEAGQITVNNVDFEMRTSSVAPVDSYNAVQYTVRGEVVITVPYRFLWSGLPPINLTINVNSTWRQMF